MHARASPGRGLGRTVSGYRLEERLGTRGAWLVRGGAWQLRRACRGAVKLCHSARLGADLVRGTPREVRRGYLRAKLAGIGPNGAGRRRRGESSGERREKKKEKDGEKEKEKEKKKKVARVCSGFKPE